MALYRVLSYARSNMEVVLAEQTGELVQMERDRSFRVRDANGYYLPHGPDWKASREEALLATALELEAAGAAILMQAQGLRNELRAAPGPEAAVAPQGERRRRSRRNTGSTTPVGPISADS